MHPTQQIPSSQTLATWLAVPVEHTADFARIARAIAGLLDAPVVLISMLQLGRHVFVGTYGVAKECADDISPLCLEVATLERAVMMQDARRHFTTDARDDHGVALASFMGLPIIGRDGTCFGAVSVFRDEEHCWHGRDLVVLRRFVALLADLLSEAQNKLLDARLPVFVVCVAVDAPRDHLMSATASTLRRHFGDTDVIAQLGNDLFMVAITDVRGRDLVAITLAMSAELERMPAWTWTVALGPGASRPDGASLADEAVRRMHLARNPPDPVTD